jgi:polysaccharide deacetylase 2 family uncharacterized protein YibQ
MPPSKRKSTSKPKSKAKGKSRSRKSAGTPARLKVLATVLVVLAVAGIATVKYLQTPRGRVLLLDRGFHTYYAQVQEETGDALKSALEDFGLRRRIDESAGFARANGKTVRYLEWDIECEESTNFVLVNVELTKAAKTTGARVRRSKEGEDGRVLVFHVGSERYDTHRITINKERRSARRKAAPAKKRPRIALVIDDFGYHRGAVVEAMLTIDMPLSIAILPSLAHSSYILERARELGRCTLLHLPMEPEEDVEPDIPPVTTEMGEQEIAAMVSKYVEAMPGIDGVNNHQGSLATADERVMKTVLEELDSHGVFFLDSLTSPKSVAYNTARALGVPAARNSVFLDADTEDSEVVEERLRRLVAVAQRQGSAIGIAHPHPWTLEALKANRTYLDNSGVELVYVSELVD